MIGSFEEAAASWEFLSDELCLCDELLDYWMMGIEDFTGAIEQSTLSLGILIAYGWKDLGL